ncbi:MAG: NADH-quinone oxidoreductase subunit N [Acidimicrobiales bacterium]|nr:NADH-quinone oxidoreductase subunit N [Acidimicrobiales bacterium]MCB9372549.1 NADH-quinone oxidoreductase subunit N [Microthrixaceae bacterium]
MTAAIHTLASLAQANGAQVDPLDTPSIEWAALWPAICLALGAILLLTIASLAKRWLFEGFYALFTVVAGLAAIATSIPLWDRVQDGDGPFSAVAQAVGVDGFSVYLTVVIASAVVLTALLADGYLRREGMDGPEFYVLMLLSATGGVIMASANDLIVMFLGLETLSISVYVLAAMHRRRATSQEAGIKYFVLGAFSSAFFLYGIAMVYGATGSTNMVEISSFLSGQIPLNDTALLAGFAFLLVGFGFKIAAVPFHSWTPDVYQGAPTPVVAYMASGVKVAGFAGLIRVFSLTFETYATDWQPIVYALAVLTLVVGALLAVVQTDVKRMLAYSSINHAGFILLGVQAATAQGTSASLFYLAAYTFMVIGTFGVITVVSRRGDELTTLDDFKGLAGSRPVLALVFTIFLLAQAGVPLTSGFFAKFYVLEAAVDASSYWLALVAMLTAVIAAFLYLRIIVAMYMGAPDGDDPLPELDGPEVEVPAAAGLALALCLAVTVFVGFFPQHLVDLANDAIPVLVATAP